MKDPQIRYILLNYLKEKYSHKIGEIIFIEEMNLCQGDARIDLAVLDENITGYEIKSDYDTLHRLSSQKEIYKKTLNKIIIVTGEKHLFGIIEAVPE